MLSEHLEDDDDDDDDIIELEIFTLYKTVGGACNVMVIMATRIQNLDKAVCISHSTNTFGEGMNPFILPPVMGKW